ncbi:MAG: PAS domain S-box protein, partial [Candidatus Hodarchaeota archaeon]
MDKFEFLQNEAKYSKVFQYLNDAIFIYDLEGHFLDVNDTACERLGYTKEELLQLTSKDIDTPEYSMKVSSRIKELQKKGRFILETAHVTKDGRVIPIELSSSVIEFEDKTAVLSIARDISKRKQMQEDLRESNNKLKTLFDTIEDFLFILDSKGRILQVNAIVEKRLGYNAEELYEQPITKVHPPNRHEEVKKIISKLLAGEISVCPIPLIAKDGSVIPVETKITQAKWGENDILIGISRDITDHLQAEQELKDSEEKFSNLFHHSNDAIFIHDLDENIIDVNQKVLDQFGFRRSEILALKVSDLHPIEELDKSKWAFDTINREGFVNFEIKFKKKNGEVFPADVSSSLFEIGGKKVIQGIVRDITERKIAEKQLRESEENYRLITENANDLITIFNSRLEYEYINEEPHFRLLGYSKDDLIGKSIAEFLYPDDLEHPFTSYEYDFENIGRELRYKRKDGTYLWLEVRGRTFIDKDREIKAILIWREISKRKEAEEVVKESEKKYRLITENANDMISVLNNRFKFDYINEQVHKKVLGYEKDELIGKNALNLIHIDDQGRILEVLKKGWEKGEGFEEFRFRHKNGDYLWLETKGKRFIDIDGNEKALMISREGAERKKAEQQLKESEERYRSYIENFHGIAYHGRMNWVPLFFHGAVEEITGYKEEEFLTENPSWDQIIYEEDFNLIGETFENIRSIPNFSCEREYRIIRKDGEIRWVHEFIKNICNESGNPIMVEGTIYDITDSKEIELKLKESEEKFRIISEHFSLGIVIFQNGFVKYVNESAAKICGYSIKEILEWEQGEFQKLFHPEDLQLILERTKKILEGNKDTFDFYITRILTKSGQIRFVENYSKLISYENEFADLITIIDITDRKIAENKLKESEEKYRNLFENSPLAIILTDFTGKIIDCNDVSIQISGYNREDLIGTNFTEFLKFQPKVLSRMKDRYNLHIRGKNLPPVEFKTYRKDGSLIWVRLFTSVIEIDSLNMIQVIIQDISEQKFADKLLKESEEKFKRIFHSIPDLFFMVTEDT